MEDEVKKTISFIAGGIYEYCDEINLILEKFNAEDADKDALINRLRVVNLEVSTGAAMINHYLDNTA
jgi:hypothetical protein